MKAPVPVQLNSYLIFDGNCEEAFKYYHQVLGGELDFSRFRNSPGSENLPEEYQDKIMHVRLTSNQLVLMGSDSGGRPVEQGNNFHLSLYYPEAGMAQETLLKLAEDGQVVMPFSRVFWGGQFGMLTDKFGINWMVSSP